MSVIRHIRNWQVADADDFDEDTRYDGQLRLRLDTSLLPRPFQVNALNSSSWIQATPGSISSSRSTAWRKTHHEVAAQAGPGGGRHQRPGAAGPVGLVHRQCLALRALLRRPADPERDLRAGAVRLGGGADRAAGAADPPPAVRRSPDRSLRAGLRADRRGAGRADLHRVGAVHVALHRILVQRAGGHGAGGGPEPGPRRAGFPAGGPGRPRPLDGGGAEPQYRRGRVAGPDAAARGQRRAGGHGIHRQRADGGVFHQSVWAAAAGHAAGGGHESAAGGPRLLRGRGGRSRHGRRRRRAAPARHHCADRPRPLRQPAQRRPRAALAAIAPARAGADRTQRQSGAAGVPRLPGAGPVAAGPAQALRHHADAGAVAGRLRRHRRGAVAVQAPGAPVAQPGRRHAGRGRGRLPAAARAARTRRSRPADPLVQRHDAPAGRGPPHGREQPPAAGTLQRLSGKRAVEPVFRRAGVRRVLPRHHRQPGRADHPAGRSALGHRPAAGNRGRHAGVRQRRAPGFRPTPPSAPSASTGSSSSKSRRPHRPTATSRPSR